MSHEARQVPAWLIFDVGRKMSYAIVYLLAFVLLPIVVSLLGALAAFTGTALIGFSIYRSSRRLASVGLLSLLLGGAAVMLFGPYALSQAEWYFANKPVAHRR